MSYRARIARLAKTVEDQAWDGAWYRRGYFDDGVPLGSKDSTEARIDSIAQSWAVISGAAAVDRVGKALRSVDEQLVRDTEQMILLFTPPFDQSPQDVGYIKGYPPGVREKAANTLMPQSGCPWPLHVRATVTRPFLSSAC